MGVVRAAGCVPPHDQRDHSRAADPRGFSWVRDVPGLPFDSLDFVPVPEPKSAKNRVHRDVTTDDLPGLLARGATVLRAPTAETRWHVLSDPEGNEFCAFPAG